MYVYNTRVCSIYHMYNVYTGTFYMYNMCSIVHVHVCTYYKFVINHTIPSLLVPLSQIDDVLPGRQTQSFGLYLGTDDEDLCFSIIYRDGGRQNALDLIASTPEEADLWVKGLLALTGSG